MDDPERHRRGAYHTGAAFERGDVHRQHGVERLPGVEPVDAQLDEDVNTIPRMRTCGPCRTGARCARRPRPPPRSSTTTARRSP